MHKIILIKLIVLLLTPCAFGIECGSLLASSSSHGNKIERVSIQKLRPTQMQYGEALVNLRANKILRQAARAGVNATDFITDRNDQYIVPAVISPRGEYFNTDSHHGISAIYKALGEKADILFNLEITKDYRLPKIDGSLWTYAEFIQDLLTPIELGGMGKGQFTQEVRDLPIHERFNHLPVRFDHLEDNPMRSLVGEALTLYGAKRKFMVDYVDFEIADLVIESGYPTTDTDFTIENTEAVADFIFSNDRIINFMKASYRTQALESENLISVKLAVRAWADKLVN